VQDLLGSTEELIIFLENARIHSSKLSKSCQDELNCRIEFIPPYTPTLAPIELVFGVVKKRMKSLMELQAINFSKNDGKVAIIKALNAISYETFNKIWVKLTKEARSSTIKTIKEFKIYE
jgi:transposase